MCFCAYITTIWKENSMKKRIVTLIIVGILLVMPSFVAISSYIYAQNNPVTEKSVALLELIAPGKEAQSYKKGEGDSEEIFDSILSITAGGDKVPSLTLSEDSYSVYTVKFHCYNKVLEYTYYLSSDPNNNFYRKPNGELYHISEKKATGFLKTTLANDLFPEAQQPTLSVGRSDNVLPSEMDWSYTGISGDFVDAAVDVTDVKQKCEVSGGLELSFSDTPDYVYAVIKDLDGNVVFDNVYDEIDPSLFANNTVYDVTVTAKWYKDASRKNYGEATYSFVANVLSPAVFYMKTYNELTYGDFVIISAKNIVDPSKIGFHSQPSLGVEPKFFEYGGYYHALVPISLASEIVNGGTLNYELTFTYGEVSQSIDLQLVKRTFGRDSQNIPLATINQLRNAETIAAFNDTLAPYFKASEDDIYWMADNVLAVPTTRRVRSGFGINIILSQAGITYSHEGVNYYVKEGDGVSACLPGKVVFVGELALSGKTVVVEHGGGLKSLYAHLSSTSVTVGQEVGKGHNLGTVGSTGFCTGTTLHFGLYVYDVPVRYYKYEANGIVIPDPIADLIK